MIPDKTAIFLLDDGLCQSLSAGRHNFLGKVRGVLEASGFVTEVRKDSVVEQMSARAGGAWTIMHMAPVLDDRSVTMRRVYHYPFWAIEQTHERWGWQVARTAFDPDNVPRRRAERFFDFWGKRLFKGAASEARRDGFVYVPLQGRLRVARRFQSCSPISMLRAVCEGTDRPVRATLHPNEVYDAQDKAAIHALLSEFPHLEITQEPMTALLAGCDVVVCENSSVAFKGYFFGKPAILFAQSDFHHIALHGDARTCAETLTKAALHTPDYAGYVHWFWQRMSVNAGREEAADKIRARLERAGWPMAISQ